MTQRDRRSERKKDSCTRPLLLGPLGTRGRASPPQNPPDGGRPLGDPTFHLQPDAACRQPGRRPHGQRQTDRLTDALKQERIAFFYTRKKQHTRQGDKDRGGKKKTTKATEVEGVEDGERMNET